jgi:hypothetical protein
MKKYIGKIEKTIYVVEEVQIIAETEKDAEELLDDYCAGEDSSSVTQIETEEQEIEIDMSWIESSEELSVDEFMEIDGGQSAYRD